MWHQGIPVTSDYIKKSPREEPTSRNKHKIKQQEQLLNETKLNKSANYFIFNLNRVNLSIRLDLTTHNTQHNNKRTVTDTNNNIMNQEKRKEASIGARHLAVRPAIPFPGTSGNRHPPGEGRGGRATVAAWSKAPALCLLLWSFPSFNP